MASSKNELAHEYDTTMIIIDADIFKIMTS